MYFNRLRSALILALGGLILYIFLLVFGKWGIRILATLFLCVFMGFIWLLLQMYFTSIQGDWANLVDMSVMGIKKESVLIPLADEVNLSGIFLTLKHNDHEAHPTILIHHGLLGKKENNNSLVAPLVVCGYNVLIMDARGHGETKQNYPTSRPDDWYITENTGIFSDLTCIIDYIISRKEADPKRIVMIGTSMGGGLALSRGTQDPRIKLIIALSPFWSWKDYQQSPHTNKVLSEPWIIRLFINLQVKRNKIMSVDAKISPKGFFTQENAALNRSRIRMIHARNDQVLHYEEHFLPLQNLLNLPSNHILVLDKGDHYLRGQETLIVAQVRQWLDDIFLTV